MSRYQDKLDEYYYSLAEEARKRIDRLVELSEEESYIMPSGLTRDERRKWAKEVVHKEK